MDQQALIASENDIHDKISDLLWEKNDFYNWIMVNYHFIGEEPITSTDVKAIWDRIRMVSNVKFIYLQNINIDNI